ncbi:MAG: hypothetical protein IKZ00_00940, partial [Bacteroidaceae bacterium]|nr:hypothetical protein [Bacteroidaceae bacterium]
PCDCSSVTDGLSINGEIYTICDARGSCITGKYGAWASGAQISVVLDCEEKKAYIQNANTNAYLEAKFDTKAPVDHKHTYNDVGAAPASHANDKNNPHGVTISQIGAAPASHKHSTDDLTSGTLPIARGGTGMTSNPSLLVNLASTSAASVFAASPRAGVTGILPVANGGTGVSSLSALATAMGAARIETGTFQGTKKHGESNKSSLTFSFTPKLVIFQSKSWYVESGQYGQHYYRAFSYPYLWGSDTLWVRMYGYGPTNSIYSNFVDSQNHSTQTAANAVTVNSNTMTWWQDTGYLYQLNFGEMQYIAIG